jgi:CBS domain-containing protein
MNIAEHFKTQQVERLDLSHYCRVSSGCTVQAALKNLSESDNNCAFVMQETRLVGIFTDRDVLRKVVDAPQRWADPIDSVMTRTPKSVACTATAMDALHLMNNHHFRNLPVMNGENAAIGNLTHFSLMQLADGLLRDEAARAETEPAAQHSLSFVSLSGLMSDKPVTVVPGTTLAECIDSMRKHNIGTLIVVDERGGIIGVFSERDVLNKVACKLDRLDSEVVGDYMSGDVVKLSPRDSIATALHNMAQRRIRRLPLVSATDKPTGVVSFRDIAGYIETSFSL